MVAFENISLCFSTKQIEIQTRFSSSNNKCYSYTLIVDVYLILS